MDKIQRVEIKERDGWSGIAKFLGNIIAKYVDVVDLDALPEPEKYFAEKLLKSMYKKYMKLSKLQRNGVKWVDYPNIW